MTRWPWLLTALCALSAGPVARAEEQPTQSPSAPAPPTTPRAEGAAGDWRDWRGRLDTLKKAMGEAKKRLQELKHRASWPTRKRKPPKQGQVPEQVPTQKGSPRPSASRPAVALLEAYEQELTHIERELSMCIKAVRKACPAGLSSWTSTPGGRRWPAPSVSSICLYMAHPARRGAERALPACQQQLVQLQHTRMFDVFPRA